MKKKKTKNQKKSKADKVDSSVISKHSDFLPEKKDIKYFLLLFALLLFLFNYMFSSSWIGGGNDNEGHAFFLWNLKDTISNDNVIPQWTSSFYGGKPFLGIYPPGAYFLFLPVAFLLNPFTTIKASWFIAYILCVYFFFMFAKYIFKNSRAAFFSSIIFIMLPYFRSNIGNMFAQIVATMFVPLILLLYEKINKKFSYAKTIFLVILLALCAITQPNVGIVICASILFLIAWDYVCNKNYNIKKIIPFFILLAFLCAFFVSNLMLLKTLHMENMGAKEFRPLKMAGFLFENQSDYSFVGLFGCIAFVYAFILLFFSGSAKKEDKEKLLKKYMILSFLLIAESVFLYKLNIDFINTAIQFGFRMFSVLSVALAILIYYGFEKISKGISIVIDKKNYQKYTLLVIIVLLIAYSYPHITNKSSDGKLILTQSQGNVEIPESLREYYEFLSEDKTFFRLDDQTFLPFGSSVIVHRHGILNGCPDQEAPKYHFFFWSNAWQMMSTPNPENFAKLYGDISIKYFISKEAMSISGFKESKCTKDFCSYENEFFQPHIRLVPNVIGINQEMPDDMIGVLNYLAQNKIDFSETVFIGEENTISNNSLDVGNIEVLEDTNYGHFKIKLTSIDHPQYLVITESYHPYFSAKYIDSGEELKIHRGIPAKLVMLVEKDGIIEISYTIPHKKKLMQISLFSFMFLILLAVYCFKKEL